ncbi:FAD:protein FMN transferase [Deinococcus humi]|nr:FAD:protein FMN transferase [Deinococcus humi]
MHQIFKKPVQTTPVTRPLATLLSGLRPAYRLHSVYERLLGTELEIQVVAQTRQHAEAAEGAALDELERLAGIFNRFDAGSELSRWLARPDMRVHLSHELNTVLALADGWRELTAGAFHPGADAVGQLWQRAAALCQEPDPGEMAAVLMQLQANPWTLHPDGTVTLHAQYPLGLNALAKGWIVDRMTERVWQMPGIQAVLVNAGGDLRTYGGRGLDVTVADPFTARDDAPPLTRVHVHNGALASSGGAHRGVQVGGRRHSHLIDPRSGQHVQDVPGVTVMAPSCATADALATTLSVLDVAEGLTLVNSLAGCAALIVGTDGGSGQLHFSGGWPPGPPEPSLTAVKR